MTHIKPCRRSSFPFIQTDIHTYIHTDHKYRLYAIRKFWAFKLPFSEFKQRKKGTSFFEVGVYRFSEESKVAKMSRYTETSTLASPSPPSVSLSRRSNALFRRNHRRWENELLGIDGLRMFWSWPPLEEKIRAATSRLLLLLLLHLDGYDGGKKKVSNAEKLFVNSLLPYNIKNLIKLPQ